MLSSGLAGKMKWDGIKSLIAPGTGGHSVHTAVIILIIVCHPLYFWFPLSLFFSLLPPLSSSVKRWMTVLLRISTVRTRELSSWEWLHPTPAPKHTHFGQPSQCSVDFLPHHFLLLENQLHHLLAVWSWALFLYTTSYISGWGHYLAYSMSEAKQNAWHMANAQYMWLLKLNWWRPTT